jgi:membrane protein
MEKKPDQFGRDATQPLLIPTRGWWQVAERVYSESVRDNLSVVAAGCAFYALFAIFPALSALISLYGLAADPANVVQNFGVLAYVLPPQAYDMVIDQIRRVAETSDRTLGWSLLISLALALWSANAGAQAMFTALNIAYEEPERRSLFHFYLSALTFTLVGIFGGLVMLIAIVYVPLLFAFVGFSSELRVGRWPFLALLVLGLLAVLYPRWTVPKQRQMAVGDRRLGIRDDGVAARVGSLLDLCFQFCQLRQDLWLTRSRYHPLIVALYLLLHHSPWG